ncbi:unnamed protein product [Clonostachys rosea f. rosea IK726]|uniref:Glycosyl hydrolase family 13 catalytic domain-containing protein n=2 Tax=Bionectria ochroleuca TaxID=29856 RepID=A0A0B7KGT3_BIOOC|nr:unnamed protein product [Clonostachys rosea f. rosea IK726]
MAGLPHVKTWWKSAVIYQIYPASFCDSNGDGIGDIRGIASKLDYIASLGADTIWLSPVYDSPQVDMGYDISNYEAIYPPYGNVDDMESLIRETHARGMRVMMDLVINHTSDQHAWFKEARSSRDNPKRDWYIWRPAKYSQSGERLPPNNWRCSFGGGSAWEWDESTKEYYLHLWAKEQPDLNWDSAEARKAIYASAMVFWLDRGVDGFRVDTVNMYSKPVDFPDAPVTDPAAPFQPAAMLYCNGPRMHEYIGEMNDILTRYEAITVGELLDTPDVARILPYVSAAARQLNMVFQFDAVEVGWGRTHKYETTPKNYTLPQFKEAIGKAQSLIQGTDAWTSAFLENHDLSRSVSRLTDDHPTLRESGAKMLAVLQNCLSGTQYIYQGQEIGAVNAPKETYPLENYLDISSRLFIDVIKERHGENNKAELDRGFTALQHLARDHSRIPMAWNSAAKYGGFSEEAERAGLDVKEPWMKPHPLSHEINVAAQVNNPDSVFGFWRKMLLLRKQHEDILVYGDYLCLEKDDLDIYIFIKQAQDRKRRMMVVLNFSSVEKHWAVPESAMLLIDGETPKLILTTHKGKESVENLAPFEGRIYIMPNNVLQSNL